MFRRRLVGFGLVSAAVVLPLATACNSGAQSAAPAKPTPSQPPAQYVTHARMPVPAPDLDETETLAGRQAETHGDGTFAYAQGNKAEALIVAVSCEGKGNIKVSLKPVRASFAMPCVEGGVSTTYNQFAVTGTEKPGTASVTAPSTVHWSMTVGRGEAADQEG
ncbi:hypothetical protein [Streptomyces sp. NPDC046821]|uniref:hypothetical protein n=1 Tax=Streptomyces sp. NPDC046821 TaxID=3154702 RepID=UPI0033C2754C